MTAAIVFKHCRMCVNMKSELVDGDFGPYTSNTCAAYSRIVRDFPIFTRVSHGELIVSPDQLNNCSHYEAKRISDIPLFEGAVSPSPEREEKP